MVFVKDEGSTFDAPINLVWKYILSGDAHDAQHKSTRNPQFEKVSDITIIYSAERNFRGEWARERMRISMFPPVSVVSELLDGPLEGSTMVYLYSPKGKKTKIDVYGEFKSKTLAEKEIESVARQFLESEFRDDAPAVRAFAKKN
jgi:hypothetical protein